jgi:DNA-directed RNA polymerase subunit RPC12/RpoP
VLKNHIDAIHGTERNYACDVCGKLFKTSPQLAGHKQTHSRSHVCTTCNRRFSHLYVLKQHMATHDVNTKVGRAPKYVCSVCGASFVRNLAQMYEAHMLEHNVVIDVPGNRSKKAKLDQFLCNMCPTKCKNSKQLRNHIEEAHLLTGGETYEVEEVEETSGDDDS